MLKPLTRSWCNASTPGGWGGVTRPSVLQSCKCADSLSLTALQCIAKTEGGKRVVAGVHWDYDCYGEIPALTLPHQLCVSAPITHG